ncbi:ArsO family NAD(P)H-dependent flavin-containing monooxygenase [Fibrivirga algicola]|uniref:NAD(P)/FAD-dependent oxidoreductase n=1 Tax=Fibrivirga algicola TaxID=2950420 RepID=A0ABX0QFC2_9BACT|nr:ArsO family NAD(P)H-dependent flavin-containing monooxygenase [Fibrivirga algicola]NID11110.1 NAD(P)/FAD-dependent oxidoreductase [Fibrivirga algicola]
MVHEIDVVVIGGGQSGLAVGYFLRRTPHSFVILDAAPEPGGAWLHGWNSLRLFSPAEASSLPGWPMPRQVAAEDDGFPKKDEVVNYLTAYETRYSLPVERPVRVDSITRDHEHYLIHTDGGVWRAGAVICATGTWTKPYSPTYPGLATYTGFQVHSAAYTGPEPFAGRRVLIVGGGNSGAQLLAEVSKVATTVWVTLTEPAYLPDDVDGRVLFNRASQQYQAVQAGEATTPIRSLGAIVMVPAVKEARDRGVLKAVRPFESFTLTGVRWADSSPNGAPIGREEAFDAIIWCTGFQPATDYLRPLGVVDEGGRVATDGTRATQLPGLWLVGFGAWTGFASATIIGVGRSARATVGQVTAYLQQRTQPASVTHS